MGAQERRARERAARHEKVIDAARMLAEREGWAAVTTRRLADEIEYTPPVLYQHFPDGRDGIVTAVALQGFSEFARAADVALSNADEPVAALVDCYVAFAEKHPATYEAMFALPVGVTFAADDTPEVMRDAFAPFLRALGQDDPDVGVNAELLWSSLHGMCTLARQHRLDPALVSQRHDRLVAMFTDRAS